MKYIFEMISRTTGQILIKLDTKQACEKLIPSANAELHKNALLQNLLQNFNKIWRKAFSV